MGLLDSAQSFLLGKTGQRGATKVPSGPSFYDFYAIDENGETVQSVTLRLAPNALQAQVPIRGQVSQDFNGDVSVLDGGAGVGRWSLSGQHGVGKLDPDTLDKFGGDSAGVAKAKELHKFFTDWVAENARRRADGKPLLRLQFALIGGGPTEFRYQRWWIWPDAMPSWRRSASSPLNWEWDFSFSALETVDAIRPLKPRGAAATAKLGFLQAAMKKLGLKPWDPNKGLLQNLQEMKRNTDKVRAGVKGAISGVTAEIRGVSGAVRGMTTNANGILKDTRDAVGNVRTIVRSDYVAIRGTALNARRLAGAIRRESMGLAKDAGRIATGKGL